MDEKLKQQAEQIVEKVRELVRDGGARRVSLKRGGETLVSFGLDCEIEIERKDGTVLNLSETAVGSKLEGIKAMAKERFGKKEYDDVGGFDADGFGADSFGAGEDPFSYPGSDFTDPDA